MNETNNRLIITVDNLSPDFKSGDVLHRSPCMFESLLQSAESDLERLHNQIRRLQRQRTAWIILSFAALGLGFMLGSIR